MFVDHSVVIFVLAYCVESEIDVVAKLKNHHVSTILKYGTANDGVLLNE